jgi:hypothetical protein
MRIAHLQSISSARTHELNRITFTYYATSIPRFDLRVVLRVPGGPTIVVRNTLMLRLRAVFIGNHLLVSGGSLPPSGACSGYKVAAFILMCRLAEYHQKRLKFDSHFISPLHNMHLNQRLVNSYRNDVLYVIFNCQGWK